MEVLIAAPSNGAKNSNRTGEQENSRLKKLVADQALDNAMLKGLVKGQVVSPVRIRDAVVAWPQRNCAAPGMKVNGKRVVRLWRQEGLCGCRNASTSVAGWVTAATVRNDAAPRA
jgi:hypothetical protein